MKITYRGKATVTKMVAEAIDGEVPTDLTGSTCNIVLTITGEKAKSMPPTPPGPPGPQKPAKRPKPAKKSTPAPARKQ
jgi:hypothetical protein